MLQGQWAAGSQASQQCVGEGHRETSAGSQFPVVEGGAGVTTDVFGGGDDFVVGRDAPPEAVAFVK